MPGRCPGKKNDIAERQRAYQGIRQGMRRNIGVAVSEESAFVRDFDSAENEFLPFSSLWASYPCPGS
jgi:hypothetical protein